MSATVMSTAEASGKIVGKIVEDLMATVPGAYVATIKYDNNGTPTTTTYAIVVDDKMQIDIASAVNISQLTDYEVVSVVKTV